MPRILQTSIPSTESTLLIGGTTLTATLLVLSSALLAIVAGPTYGLLPIAAALAVLSSVIPRFAVYMFVFSIFVNYPLSYSPLIMVVDVLPVIVIGAAILDVLLSDRLPRRLPPLSGNFAALIIALGVAALFSVDIEEAWHPIARATYIGIIALSVCRLSSSVSTGEVMRAFVVAAVVSSLPAVIGFVAAAGLERSFGWSHATLGMLSMVAFIVALYRFLTAKCAWPWLLALAIVSGGLYATQSRFPIIMVLAFAPVTTWMTFRHAPDASVSIRDRRSLVARLSLLLAVLAAMAVAAAILKPSLLAGIQWRFSLLFAGGYTGTVRLRLELYQRALEVFAAYPIFGLGPGCFRLYHELVPGSHLSSVHWWLRGLSAHNLFLHYLAETGVIGTTAMVALFVNLLRQSRVALRLASARTGDVLLTLLSLLILVTVFLEAGWLWGQTGMITALVAGLVMRRRLQHSS